MLHPVEAVNDGTINTFTRKQFNLRNPSQDSICIEDIAHALAHICRFGGHVSEFYSVAQHSVFVMFMAPRYLSIPALLHDATEAYLGDVVKPLKVILGQEYCNLEYTVAQAIAKKFGVANWYDCQQKIKPFDREALRHEHDYFFRDIVNNNPFVRAFGSETGPCWPPDIAEEMFLTHFRLVQEI